MVLILLVFWTVILSVPRKIENKNITTRQTNSKSEKVLPEKTKIEYTATKNETVYELMDSLRKENKISFTEKTYSGMGKFIDSINGISGNGRENWIYFVNGEIASMGVSNYKLKPGDVVSWKYEGKNY